MSAAAFRVLLIEDDPAHALVIRRSFEGLDEAVELTHHGDGAPALEALRAASPHERPHLLLLDLKLIGMQGLEVLEQVKSDPALRDLPVVVLTTSVSDHDRSEAFRLHANAYIQKPERLDDFRAMARAVLGFWAGCHTRN